MTEPEALALDGTFSALDLSPGQDKLAIVDANGFIGHLRLQLVDLESNQIEVLDLPSVALDGVELGAHDVVFLDDDTLLVSASALQDTNGLVPLRRIDLRTGNVEVVREIEPQAVFSRSADGSQVAITWVTFEFHTVDRYYPGRPPEEAYEVGTAMIRPYGVALSRDGSQLAIPARAGVLLFDAESTLLETIGELEDPLDEFTYVPRPFSAIYSPNADLLYVAWSAPSAPDETPPSIDVYETSTFTQQAVIEAAKDLYWQTAEQSLFTIGRMRMSKDGSHLFAVSTWGIAVYNLGP